MKIKGNIPIDDWMNALQGIKNLTSVKRVFNTDAIKIGDLVRVHRVQCNADAIFVDKDYFKGVVDLSAPDALKILVRDSQESEPSVIRIPIEEMLEDYSEYNIAESSEMIGEFLNDDDAGYRYLIEVI